MTMPPPPPRRPSSPAGPGHAHSLAVDAQLLTLIDLAESGDPCPPIKVATGAAFISGTPASTPAFGEAMQKALEAELWAPYRETGGKDRKEAYLQEMEALKPSWQRVIQADPDRAEPVLTLVDAEMAPNAGGDGLAVPALRIPTGAVDAWWFAGARRIPARGGSAFGVAFPLPNLG